LKELRFTSQEVLLSIGGGACSALLFSIGALGSIFTLILSYFSPLPLFLIGFSHGIRPLLIASLVSLLSILVFGGNLVSMIFFAILTLAPVLLLTRQSLLNRKTTKNQVEWYPSGLMLSTLTAYNLVLVAFLFSLFLTVPASQLEEVFSKMLMSLNPQLKQEDLSLLVKNHLIHYLPAVFVVSSLLMTLLNAFWSQKILIKAQRNLRPMPSLIDLSLPWWHWIALAASGLVALLFRGGPLGFFAMNAVLLLTFTFLLEGLTIIHSILRKFKNGNLFLLIFYLIVVVFGWFIILIVTIFGIFEPWLHLRQRFSKDKD
jgi:hypothetical protein